ncbi:hypothetical protein Patl1_15628 [Pistacia atlantica]|uniref:Uncharacterized protein n=1 Tax=Pistacia atlantica TaxID=434234 RepID=A0ACC1BAW7_9ROSI|nr:hypothetical protein Patl1_15628 [Pistacia atlantica]
MFIALGLINMVFPLHMLNSFSHSLFLLNSSLNGFMEYTHIHFGAIRLALTFHGRKGLPTTARIALLDTRFPKYISACIGSMETTLNAGIVMVTFYPNFNILLNDQVLPDFLKVQISW